MNITLLDAGTREVIRIVECPKSPEYVAAVMTFVEKMGASIASAIPHELPDEWKSSWRSPPKSAAPIPRSQGTGSASRRKQVSMSTK